MNSVELLHFLETTFPELNWTISPNLTLGMISTSTFELSKNPEKLQKLLKNLETQTLILQNTKLEKMEKLENPKIPKLENLEISSKNTEENSKINSEIENKNSEKSKTEPKSDKKNSEKQNSQNPIQITQEILPKLEILLAQIGVQIKSTGAYLNLDLTTEKWQNFLEM